MVRLTLVRLPIKIASAITTGRKKSNENNKTSNGMKDKIKEICERLNREQASVHGATNELFDLFNVVGQSEQLAEHECKFYVNAEWTALSCECGKRIKPKG